MKLFLIAILLVIHTGMNAQNLRTIFTNERDAVALFFPNTIRQGLTGSESFTFSYNRENPQHVGIVQGVKGDRSNLLVITENGDVFSYRLVYRKVLDTLNYFVAGTERIGNEAPASIFSGIDSISKVGSTKKPDPGKVDSLRYRKEHFRKFSSFHLKHNDNLLKKRRKQGLVLRLKDLIYDRTEVYALVEIGNRSGIDLETDYLKVFKVHGNNRRKSSYQKLPLDILYRHNFPDKVRDGESASFVVVLPKFTLGDSEKLMLELSELHGSRNIRLFYK
ncbi:protein of unknown function [Pricia antarctica]|uniref:Conjugal transfer protein n=1 Tax=Pricia antarctica TaxID=641691 RepID=A0A1G7HI70_9FLAO|nr:DUF4138 domain-containing protein [Pricia antarctica]SDF00190.1 protein of unknown function [Pricia antarctica]